MMNCYSAQDERSFGPTLLGGGGFIRTVKYVRRRYFISKSITRRSAADIQCWLTLYQVLRPFSDNLP